MREGRGVGRIFRPAYRDSKTREKKHVAVWWVRYGCRRTCGRAECSGVHQESSHSDNRRVAERLLRKRLGEVGLGKLVTTDVERTSFEELSKMLVADYAANGRKSLRRAQISIAHLREAFGNSRAIAISTDRLNQYVADRLMAKAKPATIRCELAALRRMFTLALQAGKVAVKPHIPRLHVSNARAGFFEEPELRAVLT